MDQTIDGRPVIRCAWLESSPVGDAGPAHTLDETAAYMRLHGIPNATKQTIQDIERTALRKLRHHPIIKALAAERRRT